jgi:hypothetical protein
VFVQRSNLVFRFASNRSIHILIHLTFPLVRMIHANIYRYVHDVLCTLLSMTIRCYFALFLFFFIALSNDVITSIQMIINVNNMNNHESSWQVFVDIIHVPYIADSRRKSPCIKRLFLVDFYWLISIRYTNMTIRHIVFNTCRHVYVCMYLYRWLHIAIRVWR